jgi:hypothetical protein
MKTVVIVLIAVLLVAVIAAFLIRRRLLLTGLGAVTMWLRPAGSARWAVGVGWFGGDTLLWYRALSLKVRPNHRLSRADLAIESKRAAGRGDEALPADVTVLTCSTLTGTVDLAMEPSTATGFLSWVESAPPVR